MPPERRSAAIGSGVVFGLVAIVGCSTALTSGDESAAEVLPAALVQPDTTTAITAITSTVAPATTAAPTTTAASTTAVAPTTTTATTTTATTTTTLPAKLIEVPTVDPPIPPIGTESGEEAARLQQRLIELGFWVSGTSGEYGITTKQAVMAFEKYMGFEADGSLDERSAAAISSMALRPVARANSGTLVEVDKGKQLLFFVIDGKTEYILNASTGNGEEYEEPDQNSPGEIVRGVSLTPSGLHEVNRERPEGWWEGDLGEIYRPKYFIGGVAVHGSGNIPNYPASHGCVRVSVPAMDWIWEADLMPMDSPVWVHDGA